MPKRYRSSVVQTVDEYVKHVSDYKLDGFVLFRGQRSDWSLLPRVSRLQIRGNIVEAERQMLNDFKIRTAGLLPSINGDGGDWEWLAIAQHHGMATRMLDWSSSALTALWFAVSEVSTKKSEAVVWCFEPDDKSDIAKIESDRPFDKGGTKVYRPRHLNNRIRAQEGWFTLHRPHPDTQKFVPLERNVRYQNKLRKVKVPHDCVGDFRATLDRLGINRSSLFPDLDGVARHCEWLHSLMDDELG